MKITSKGIATASIIVVFLALIRCIGEFFRLDHIQKDTLTIEAVKPFIAGALVCAVSLLFMYLLFLYAKFKWIIALAITAVVVLFFLKFHYGIK